MAAVPSTTLPRFRAPGRRRPDQLPGGRHGLSRQVVEDSQRERLLEAMTITAGRRGYRDAHITEVVDRAGVSRRTFYEQFEGKEDCFAAAYARALERFVATAVSAFEETDAEAADDVPAAERWAGSLRAALAALLKGLAARPEAARVCFVEVLGAGVEAAARRDEALRGFLPLFADAPTDVPRTQRIFESLAMGRIADLADVVHREIAAGHAKQLPDLLPELTYMMVLPFLGPQAAARELADAPPGDEEAA